MRFSILAVVLAALLTLAFEAQAAESYTIRDDRRVKVGDIYCPNEQRRCQIRDTRRNILGYVDSKGVIRDKRRRKVGTIEGLLKE